MPYITSIVRLAKEEGFQIGLKLAQELATKTAIEKGRRIGKIELLQQLHKDSPTERTLLIAKPEAELDEMVQKLQVRLRDSR